jgi:hypothetical protein
VVFFFFKVPAKWFAGIRRPEDESTIPQQALCLTQKIFGVLTNLVTDIAPRKLVTPIAEPKTPERYAKLGLKFVE